MGVGAEFDGAFEQRGAGTGAEGAVEEWACPIDDDARGIEIIFGAEPIASGTRAVG